MIAAILIPLSFWWFFKLREPGFVKAAKQEKTPFWKDMKRTASNRNFIMLTLTIFTLAMGFNFVSCSGHTFLFFMFSGVIKLQVLTCLGSMEQSGPLPGYLQFSRSTGSARNWVNEIHLLLRFYSCAWHNFPRLSATTLHYPYLIIIPLFCFLPECCFSLPWDLPWLAIFVMKMN